MTFENIDYLNTTCISENRWILIILLRSFRWWNHHLQNIQKRRNSVTLVMPSCSAQFSLINQSI